MRSSTTVFRAIRNTLAAAALAALGFALLTPTVTKAVPGAPNMYAGEGCHPVDRNRWSRVKCVQGVLMDYAGHPLTDGADGCYGAQTEAGVKDLQRYFGLVDDGIVGPETGDVIDTIIQLRAPAADRKAWNSGCYFELPTKD
ncbi:MAG TPA: peptidoglycan-binding domain-containing protein [Polyangiales bacterium]|nr:peptidoglycan-binding domain-containing protein [Polyangiales bacterium]